MQNDIETKMLAAFASRGIDASGGGLSATWCEGRIYASVWDSTGHEQATKSRDDGLLGLKSGGSARCDGAVAGGVMGDGMRELLAMGWHGEAPPTIVVVEGEIDLWTWESIAPEGVIVCGVAGGMFSKQIAEAIPDGSTVILRTHQDGAGEKMAQAIARHLGSRCCVLRLVDGDDRDEQERLMDLALSSDPMAGCQPYTPPPLPAPLDGEVTQRPEGEAVSCERGKAWWAAALPRMVEQCLATGKGGRFIEIGAIAYRAGGHLAMAGSPSEEEVAAELIAAAEAAGLEKAEAKRTVASGLERGRRKPLPDPGDRPPPEDADKKQPRLGEEGIVALLRERPEFATLRRNGATGAVEVEAVPWERDAGPWSNRDTFSLMEWISQNLGAKSTKAATYRAVRVVAELRQYMPTPVMVAAEDGGGPAYDSRYDDLWEPGDTTETALARRLCRSYLRPGVDEGTPPGLLISTGEGLWRPNASGLWDRVTRYEVVQRMSRWDGADTSNTSTPRRLSLSESAYGNVISLATDGILRPDPAFFSDCPRGFATQGDFVRVDTASRSISVEALTPAHRQRHALTCERPEAGGCIVLSDPMGSGLYGRDGTLLGQYLRTIHEGCDDAAGRLLLMGQIAFLAVSHLGPTYHRALMAFGDPGTGKSSYVEMVRALIPEAARSTLTPSQMSDEKHQGGLDGKMLNAVTEIGDQIVEVAAFKTVVSGEEIRCRGVYEAPLQFKPAAQHIFAGNVLPKIRGGDKSVWDRWIALRFERVFRGKIGTEVKFIGEQIAREETGELVAWVLRCGQRLLIDGCLHVPECSAEIERQWRAESDPVVAWMVEEEIALMAEGVPAWSWPLRSAAFRRFSDWAADNGYKGMNSRTFAGRLQAAGVRYAQSNGPRVGLVID